MSDRKKQLNIIQINGSFGFSNSTGRTTKEMHEWFCAHGINSYCFISSFNDDSQENARVKLYGDAKSFKIHALFSRIFGLQGYFSGSDTDALIKQMDERKPDIVILRVLHNNSIHFPKLFKYLSKHKIATVIVLHDCFFFTGHCTYYTQYKCKKWQTTCGNCPAIHHDNVSWFFDMSFKCFCDKKKWFHSIHRLAVVGVSEWITNESKKSLLKEAHIIQRVYNWVDLDLFRPKNGSSIKTKYKISENQKVILGVATVWSESKGFSTIIHTAKQIEDALVILVGQLLEGAKDISNNVKIIGKVTNPEILAEYYSMADVFLNPTRQETFGKTTAEAISCGTPVVAYRTTACVELINNKRGKLVDYQDQDGFVSAVKEVLKCGKEKYCSDLRAFAEANFNKEKNMEAYMNIFYRLQSEVRR